MSLEKRLEDELTANLITYLLLKCVSDSPSGYSYGYEMKKYVEERIQKQFPDKNTIPEGTLYPILSKLADKEKYGYLESFRKEKGKQIRYYRLTPSGKDLLQSWPLKWKKIVASVNAILQKKEV